MSQEQSDILWMLVTASLVFMMQGGFMCLESGFTRSKNSINVALKNFTDFGISFCLFWGVGFGLMFGATRSGWIGTDSFLLPFESIGEWRTAFFFFQAMFCATSVTILSGAAAERMHYLSYSIVAVIVSGLIYPVFGHWVWNGADGASGGGWLGERGFIDFAGSSVVHSVGGWVSLAILLIIGPRHGRFPEGGPPQRITGHDVPMSVLGALLLFMGWFGFNGGSTLTLDASVARIVANTALAASFGGITTLAIGWTLRKRPDAELVINGTLAGLVAITANCHAVTAAESLVIGSVGGMVMLALEHLLVKCRIDDAVGAIPVHLGAGIWGTLAVAFFGDAALLKTGLDFQGQFIAQCLGVASAAVWAFGLTFLICWPLNRYFPFRVSAEAEEQGLNYSEHGATTELIDLLQVMDSQGKTGDLSARAPVEPFTEVGQIARRYNQVLDYLQKAVARSDHIVRDIQDGIVTFTHQGMLTSLNPGAEKLFGYSMADAMGQPVSLLLAAESGNGPVQFERFLSQSANGRPPLVYGVRRNQERFPVDFRLSRSGSGGAYEYTGLVKDVTEQKLAEDALEASRDRIRRHNQALTSLAQTHRESAGNFEVLLRTIAYECAASLELDRVSVWRIMEDGERLANVYVLAGTGGVLQDMKRPEPVEFSPALRSAVQGQRIISTDDAMNDPRTESLWTVYLNEHNTAAMLIAQINLGGELRGLMFFEHVGGRRPWFPEEAQFAASASDFLVLAYEEAERRYAQDALREMNESLEVRVSERTRAVEQSNRELRETLENLERTQNKLITSEKMAALGELVAGVAHEINTPVGVAVTATSHLQLKTRELLDRFASNGMKKSDLDNYLRIAGESTTMLMTNLTRASELVQSFKKVAVDQSSEAMRVFDLKQYVGEVLLSLQPKLKKTKHEITLECPDDLELHTYPGALSQVITNLIVNSMIHGFEEEDEGQILMRFTPEGQELLFTYQDNGKGIPPEYLGRIFDPFFTTRRGTGGSGLGLHILYNIVSSQLQGSIHCESTPGKGTTFYIRMATTIEDNEV